MLHERIGDFASIAKTTLAQLSRPIRSRRVVAWTNAVSRPRRASSHSILSLFFPDEHSREVAAPVTRVSWKAPVTP
jgi:hypothetical protein